MTCPHYQDSRCEIASGLAGVPVVFDVRACDACQRATPPQSENKVTVDIAAHHLRKLGKLDQARQLQQRHGATAPPPLPLGNKGPGAHLAQIIPAWAAAIRAVALAKVGDCGCTAYAAQMNYWGVDGCTRRFDEIVDHLVNQAGPIATVLPVRPVVARWVRQAIERAQGDPQPAANNGRWAVAITTAPRRDCTLRPCVESVRACGWEPIIFAEPGATETDCFTVQNESRRGVWHNWLHSMRWTLANTDAELILSVQDDSLFHPDSRTFTESILWPDPLAGFVSLYTPKHYTIRSADKSMRPAGVNRIHTRSLWGACALVFDRRILQRVVDSATARNWTGAPPRSRSKSVIQKRRDNPEIIANSDTAIGKVMNRMGRKMYFIDPSPVTHIAKHSTISHGDNTGRRNAYRAADHAVPLADQVPAPEKRCELQV